MKILIDGDACSVIDKTEKVAKSFNVETHIFCDTCRIIDSDYSELHIVDKGPNSTDFALVKHIETNDIVITNDTGLASMALARKAKVINSHGTYYTEHNIMEFLTRRHICYHEQRKQNRKQCRGLVRRQSEQNKSYASQLNKLIKSVISA